MVVRKILESTLVAGATTVTFTDTEIPNSLLRVYCTKSGLFPISQTLSGNSVTVNYKPQDSNVGVALEIVKSGLDIVDDLVTDDSSKALSANQGYVLKGLIDNIVIPTVPENITDLDDVSVDDISNGQVLAWNSETEKFENVDQSGGAGGINYSLEEQDTGLLWYDGKHIYQKTFVFTSGWTPLGSWNTLVNLASLNIDAMIDISGTFYRGDYLQLCFKGSAYPESSGTYKVSTRYYNSNLEAVVLTYNDITKIIITIQYTKN